MAIYDKSTEFVVNTPEWNAKGKEPDTERKNQGFFAGFKPPAAYFNWFWNCVCKNLAEIKNKISDLWSFITATDFLIYEKVSGGVFYGGESIRYLFSATYKDKKNYILTGEASEELATEIGISAGMAVEVSNRYPNRYNVYIPSIHRLYTYFSPASNYYTWDYHKIGADDILDGAINPDKLSSEIRNLDVPIYKEMLEPFYDTKSLQELFSRYYSKKNYILLGEVGEDLASELGISSGEKIEVSNRYGRPAVYVPSRNRMFTYTDITAGHYYWNAHNINTNDIADGVITLDKLSDEVLALIQK